MRRTYIVLGVVALIMLVVVVYLTSSPEAANIFRSTRTVTNTKQANAIAQGFVGAPYIDDYQMLRIPGYMDNVSKSTLAAVNLEIQLLDDKGNRKEVVKYTVSDIPAGRRKTFDANAGPINGPRTAQVKIISVEVVK